MNDGCDLPEADAMLHRHDNLTDHVVQDISSAVREIHSNASFTRWRGNAIGNECSDGVSERVFHISKTLAIAESVRAERNREVG